MTTTKNKSNKPALRKFLITEQFFLNWECEATSEKEARAMYETYISDVVQREQLVTEALENKWDNDVNVEEASE
jgi:hypothetical protein